MKGSRYSILAGIEDRVKNRDSQQTVNLLLNGTVGIIENTFKGRFANHKAFGLAGYEMRASLVMYHFIYQHTLVE